MISPKKNLHCCPIKTILFIKMDDDIITLGLNRGNEFDWVYFQHDITARKIPCQGQSIIIKQEHKHG